MAAAAQSLLLQQQSIKLKNHLLYHPPQFAAHTCSAVNFKIRTSFKKLTVESFSLNNNSVNVNRRSINGDSNHDFNKIRFPTNRNTVEIAAETLTNALRALQKPAAKAVVILGLLLFTYNPNKPAFAASGGRMGGSSFPSESSRNSSSSSSSSSSSGYSSSSRYSSSSPSSYSSYKSSNYSSSSGPSSSYPSYSSLSSLSSTVAPAESSRDDSTDKGLVVFGAFVVFMLIICASDVYSKISADTISVIKLQIGLLGSARSLQKDLNKIAETADTSTSEGLHEMLTDSALAVLRYPEYCISTFLSVDVKFNMEAAQQRFFKLTFEERSKFDEETLVNVNNVKKQSATTPRPGEFSNEHIVVTILVTARRKLKLPRINNIKDLKEVLEKLGCLPLLRILAVEVLWTPQNEDDTLSEQELLENYPLLRPLQ